MKLILTLTLLLLGLTVFLSFFLQLLGLSFLPTISFGVGVLVILIFVFKAKNKNELSMLLLITIILSYTIVPYSLFLGIVGTFAYHQNKNYIVERSNEAKKQNYSSIKVGRIAPEGSQLVYKCDSCGYQISFPNNWGFSENGLHIVVYNPEVLGYTFSLVTPNYLEPDTNLFSYEATKTSANGAKFEIESSANPHHTEVISTSVNGNLGDKITNKTITVKNISIEMRQIESHGKYNTPPTDYAWFKMRSHYFIVTSGVFSFSEFESYIKQLVENVEVI